MNLRQLARTEAEELDASCKKFATKVERSISRVKGSKFTFSYGLSINESRRLLKLKVWSERYSVSLDYILGRMLPFWESFIQRKTRRAKSRGLGVRIATLTGKKSEQMLQLFIQQDFPAETHILLARQNKQQAILSRMDKPEDGIPTSSDFSKTMFDFPYPGSYLQYYRRRMKKQAKRIERITQEFQKYPYRGNPFV